MPTSWDSPHGGVGAPGRLLIGSDLENLIPCPWSRSRLPSDWGRRGTESWQHPALRTLVTMETESLDCSVNIERAAASQKGSEEPHYWPLLDWMGQGGRSQGDRPASPPNTSVNWLLPSPSWSSPEREWFRRAHAHSAGEEAMEERASGSRSGFQIGLGVAATLAPACLRS